MRALVEMKEPIGVHIDNAAASKHYILVRATGDVEIPVERGFSSRVLQSTFTPLTVSLSCSHM